MKTIFLLALLMMLPGAATADDGSDQAVLSAYRSFAARLLEAESIDDLSGLLSASSPLREALGDESARRAFGHYRRMLSRFHEKDVSVTVDGDAAEVVARGKTPVDDPQVRRFIDVASATYRVSFVRESGTWKVANTRYKIRHSD